LIAVCDYGMGNLHSVSRALSHVGADVAIATDPETALRGDGLVVPGVGAFGACMTGLREAGFDQVIRDFVGSDRPVLAVCIGLQVLFEGSDETPGVEGVGILPGRVVALPDTEKIPHMGWNQVRWVGDHPIARAVPDGTYLYFVHSYAAPVGNTTIGVTEYGMPFSAAVSHGSLFATQFHPEKSGDPGLAVYEAFAKECA
jgi:imidazole glycerol-phosphate synthase subunit HisH